MIYQLAPGKNELKLMRIPFSYFLMPVFLFALSLTKDLNVANAIIVFIALHLFIYPASNGYNSYMDQDETSIGGIKNPPKATKKLFFLSFAFDVIGLALSLLVGLHFFLCLFAYMLASRAYSYKGIRLKKRPILGFLTVIFFQGGFTFWMVITAISKSQPVYDAGFLSVVIACSFLIAGVYPLTQIYQHDADLANGDITISFRLGYTGTFLFSGAMFFCADLLIFYYFYSTQKLFHFILFEAFLLPVIIYFTHWFLAVTKDTKQASFEKTMSMNLIASTCMNLCFITLFILNSTQ
jgi:1,4-dihydroxy-2-naphthoate octaprenyltransferase